MNVAIIGMGIVGKAQVVLFGGHVDVAYDIRDAAPYPVEAISDCDFAVVCAGTPPLPDGHADLSAVEAAVFRLPPSLPVLIRSTLPPGTTDRLARGRRPGLVAHAPEFICERDGGEWSESGSVPWMLLGGQPQAVEFFEPLLAHVFPGHIWPCSAIVAELAKYTANVYWATRVTFVNEMSQISAAYGVDWALVRQAWLEDDRVTPNYTRMEGFPPGFDGHCWPKDLQALIAAADDAGYKAGFLEAVQEANWRFRS